jgi:hypothetical protein
MSRPAENVVSRRDADLTKAIYARVPVADRDRFADCPPGMGATPARSPQPRQSLGRYAMHYLSWRRGGLYIAPMSSACVHGSTRVEELALNAAFWRTNESCKSSLHIWPNRNQNSWTG